jgi:hypothetical protein
MILFGEKEELVQVVVKTGGPYLSLIVRAEQRPDVENLIAELEKARGAASQQ